MYLDRLDSNADFTALDVETTGRATWQDVVVEIGAIRYVNGYEVERLVTLVKAGTSMLPWITKLTGITDEMLVNATPSGAVASRLVKFLGWRPLVVHNAGFDIPILERFLSRHAPGRLEEPGRGWIAPPVMCTLRQARRLLPHLRSRSLPALSEHFDFTPRFGSGGARFHRAGTDAEAAAHVFFCMSAMSERAVWSGGWEGKARLKAHRRRAQSRGGRR